MDKELAGIYSTIKEDTYLSALFGSYKRAVPYVRGMTVYDYGCGYGWGTYFLSHYCKHIIGADIDKERIDYARKNMARNNLLFRVLDDSYKQHDIFEIICLFQVIQWVRDPEAILGKLKKNIKDEGIIIITTKESCKHATEFMGQYFSKTGNVKILDIRKIRLSQCDSIIEYIMRVKN